MKFKYLEYAVMIQYCHSISKAAEKLYVSQPALSETINRMEEELGFIVFKRTNKGIEITPLGEKFIQDAEEILQIKSKWDVYAQQSTDLLEDISEEVHLALTPSLCDVFIASFFYRLRDKYHNLSIILHQMPTEDICKYLLRENVSLGIFSIEPQRVKEFCELFAKNHFETKFLYRDELKLLVLATDPLAKQKKVTLSDLQHYTLMMLEEKSSSIISTKFSSSFCKKHVLPKTDNMLNALTQPGNAAIFASRSMQENYLVQQGIIKMIPFCEEFAEIDNFLVYRKEKFLSRGERVIVKTILNEY